MKTFAFFLALFLLPGMALSAGAPATQAGVGAAKTTLAVLPFLGTSDKEKALAERMRFAVSQKLSNDADLGKGAGQSFERMDNVQVEQTISALGIPWEAGGPGGPGTLPEADDLQKLFSTLGSDEVIAGTVKGRKLTLLLYAGSDGRKPTRTASVDIPSDRESPKLAVEKILTDLTGAKFAHMRDVEADHSDPAAEKRFAQRPNLVTDPGFEDGAKAVAAEGGAAADKRVEKSWEAILGPDHYPPAVISAAAARQLPQDKVAVVPLSAATGNANSPGHCLMMRMSKNVAENNGLACESTWIPVEAGKKYRFTCRYFSEGPTARLFLKGFAYKPDQYGDKKDPEAVRREYYRAQVAPRKKNTSFELIEMDFTPSSLKPTDPKIEWMRVDLYIYLTPGTIFFDDVTMKKLDG